MLLRFFDMHFLCCQSKIIPVQTEQGYHADGSVVIEPLTGECSTVTDVQLECSLVQIPLRGVTDSPKRHTDFEIFTKFEGLHGFRLRFHNLR